MVSQIRKRYADTHNGQLHFAEAGDGKTLLLIGETPRGWRFFHKLLPLLAPRMRAIAIDLPGLGNSHGLPTPASIPAIAACLADLLDAIGIERADVFGMHTGDKVAAAFAADWPSRVGKLVLAGQTHSLIPEIDKRNEALAPFFARYRASRPGSEDVGARQLREWLVAKLVLDATWWPDLLVSHQSDDPRLIEFSEAQSIDYLLGWRNAVPIYEAVFAYDLADAVARIEAETLVLEFLSPEEEHYGPQAGRLAKLMKNATAQAVEVTYLTALEHQADKVACAVLNFLGQGDA